MLELKIKFVLLWLIKQIVFSSFELFEMDHFSNFTTYELLRLFFFFI